MADDRMYLRCKACGEQILLAKCHAPIYNNFFHADEKYDRFLRDHSCCNHLGCKGYQYFELKYESED